MIQEPILLTPVTDSPLVNSSPVTTSENEEPVIQEPEDTNVTNDEEEEPHQSENNVPSQENLRRSSRVRKSAISEDYEVYMSEEIQMEGDPTTFEEAIRSPHSSKWLEAMEDEIKSMSTNKVWKLEDIPKGAKTVGCKWVYKIKRDSQGNIDRFKARLVAKGFYPKRRNRL